MFKTSTEGLALGLGLEGCDVHLVSQVREGRGAAGRWHLSMGSESSLEGQKAGFEAAGRGQAGRVDVVDEASLAPCATKGNSSCG